MDIIDDTAEKNAEFLKGQIRALDNQYRVEMARAQRKYIGKRFLKEIRDPNYLVFEAMRVDDVCDGNRLPGLSVSVQRSIDGALTCITIRDSVYPYELDASKEITAEQFDEFIQRETALLSKK